MTAHDVRTALERQGFEVVGSVDSLDEADRVAAGNDIEIAVIDVRLEGIDEGVAVADALCRRFGISPVFVTGYSEEAVFSKAARRDSIGFLRKPFSDPELIACMEEAAERAEARKKLSAQLPSMEVVLDSIDHPMFIVDRDGRLRFGNRTAAEELGWNPVEMLGCRRESVIHPLTSPEESRENEDPRIEARLREDHPWTGREKSRPLRGPDGDLLGTILHLVPAREQSDLGAPVTSAPEPTFSSSDSAPSPESPPSANTGTAPAIRSSAVRKLANLAHDPSFRELIRKPSREARSSSPALGPNPGDQVGSDISSAPEADTTVSGIAPLAEQSDDPVLRMSEDGTIQFANDSAVARFGLGGHGERRMEHLFDESIHPTILEGLRKPLEDGRKHRFTFLDPQRELRFEVRAYRVEDGVLALFSETGETDAESAEAIRQQRLEGLGLLARGFAHDFNNHLTTITGNISLARERHPEDEDLHHTLTEAQTAATRATGLVQQLMTFARGGRPIRKRIRVSDLVRRILTEQRLQHPEIRFQFQAAETDLVASVDPAQVSRLLENLVTNSTLAMSEGGILIVRVDRASTDEVTRIKPSHTAAEEDHLLIEVIDTGHGMDEESLGQVFEPYFTTRREDNASGIGLTVCESIARAHRGFIQLQSKEGKGTIATFCAPLGLRRGGSSATEAEADPGIPPLQEPDFRGERHGDTLLVGTRILILEDDAPIRRLIAATLRRAGHEVVETKEGRETVAAYREAMERGAKFHLLICDLTIENGMGGVETMRELTRMDPSILAIVSSGYSDAPAMSDPAAFGFRGVLPKPYAPSELRAAVHRMLSAYGIIS